MQTNDSSQDGVILSIELLRIARGMTRKDLAEKLGKDQFWIGHRMNNRVMFKFHEIEAIAAAFGLTIEQFLAVPDAIPQPMQAVAS
ncbi:MULTISPECIES: helix-turn-helix domain-containing protein [unclassified Leucobacter]|uniref:helix-turn-helix domain-containing protein n=1 Tax=unclassified Leucobacter TaxID=2621730 RepID=UPI000621D167|nr:helix-turn-helix transcriptional regulator [Leucobacter sp. Ag1]KKI18744.1 hypothetical protein XM48_10740 [Leucobacter sp. Ag1]